MVTSFSRKTRLKTWGHAGDFIELSDLAEFLHGYLVTPGGEVNIHLAYEFYNWAYEKL